MMEKLDQVGDLMTLQRLSEELNSEISLMSLDMPDGYDWKVMGLVQRAQKHTLDDLLKLIAKNCPTWYDKSFSEAYSQLDTRMHLAT